jgi:hypothetical protein
MNKKLKTFIVSFMLITPMLTIPKLPTIPNISGSVKVPVGVEEAAKNAGAEAVKNLNINWGEIFKNIEVIGHAREL